MANAMASGKATNPTVIPAIRSDTNFLRSYVRRKITDFGSQESMSIFIIEKEEKLLCVDFTSETVPDFGEIRRVAYFAQCNQFESKERFQTAVFVAVAGFHRSVGLRAAATSSRRLTRVVCGACLTMSGVSAASLAMFFIASMKRSHSSFDSDSVGSIISAPGTMRGNAVVYGWKP